jgi:hypothetical protein
MEKGIIMGKESSIQVYEEDGLLHFVVDPSREIGPSASGKTTLVASSGGNASITLENGTVLKLGLNLYY